MSISVCACDPTGAVEEICDKTDGECLCKDNFNGLRCDECARGYWGYPACVGRYKSGLGEIDGLHGTSMHSCALT